MDAAGDGNPLSCQVGCALGSAGGPRRRCRRLGGHAGSAGHLAQRALFYHRLYFLTSLGSLCHNAAIWLQSISEQLSPLHTQIAAALATTTPGQRREVDEVLRTDEFDYQLPQELIAQTPIEPRDAARMLVVERATGTFAHRHFRDLSNYLAPGDLLVLNESRVIPARLLARKVPSGGRVELLLLTRHDPRTWEALVGGRRAPAGTRLRIVGPASPPAVGQASQPANVGQAFQPATAGPASQPAPVGQAFEPAPNDVLEAEIVGETPSGGRLIRFSAAVDDLLDTLGQVPLPPYIHAPLADRERYQTVYAKARGSVAAPTAGLHFTPQLLSSLAALGVGFATVTLHIGLDTFRPVTEEHVEEHAIHREWCRIDAPAAEAIAAARARGGRVVAVGTTTVRVLETAAQAAVATHAPEPVVPFSGWTDLYIYPGYRFRAVDALVTNFHLPRSTLLMLVSAFAGRDLILRAYHEAIRERYRFYSFGDAMLIL